jgi:hypothetical protein
MNWLSLFGRKQQLRDGVAREQQAAARISQLEAHAQQQERELVKLINAQDNKGSADLASKEEVSSSTLVSNTLV